MTIELLFPTLPPALDGIGDYTVHLATALQSSPHRVLIRSGRGPSEVPNVEVVGGYDFGSWSGLRRLTADIEAARPDWVVLQYNPFSYGRWGFNPMLPLALWNMRKKPDSPRLAVMVHEAFAPVISWQFGVMTTWQRLQFYALGRMADLLFLSISPWAVRFDSWFPSTPVHHLPVGSNMPRVAADSSLVRDQYEINANDVVLGIFGSAHPSRLLSFVGSAVDAVAAVRPAQVLYVGAAGHTVGQALGEKAPFIDAGPLPGKDVSRAFAAMDLYLAPFHEGVSTRRGSFMAGLQHGIPSLSTYGAHTDPILLDRNGSAFVLVPDDDPEAFATAALDLSNEDQMRKAVGTAGRTFFDEHFSWSTIAQNMGHLLSKEAALSNSRPPLIH
jgi:glycosyltransferase involved in cell wall biosynthesis